MSKIRVAFIGAGAQANLRHYPSVFSLQDEVELAALCDLDEQRARKTAERWGVPRIYTNYKQMLDEVDPQAVYIIMRPDLWHDLAAYTLKQGRHVYSEQPPVLTTTQIRTLAHHAERHHCLTMVSFQRRYIPAQAELRRRVEERGAIHSARIDFLTSTKHMVAHGGMTDWDGLLDWLNADGIHAVDCMRYLCGGEVTRVMSNARPLYIPDTFASIVTAIVEFSTGAVGQLFTGYVCGRRIFRAEFHGRDVSAYVDADRETHIVADDGEPEVWRSAHFGEALMREWPDLHPNNFWEGHWHAHRHFVDCLKEHRQPSSSFADATKTRELVDQILFRAGER
jgi:virulence factor